MPLLGNNVGGVLQSEVTRSYNSFSGSDIRCQIGQFSFAEVQAVSYSVTREKAPIYTMGSADVRSFSRNKRGIAGSLVWVNFDRHALLNPVYKLGGSLLPTAASSPNSPLEGLKTGFYLVNSRSLRLPRLPSDAALRSPKTGLAAATGNGFLHPRPARIRANKRAVCLAEPSPG